MTHRLEYRPTNPNAADINLDWEPDLKSDNAESVKVCDCKTDTQNGPIPPSQKHDAAS